MKQNDRAGRFLRKFLKGSEITDDFRNTLDDLVRDKLEYHLIAGLGMSMDCTRILHDLANSGATRINELPPEDQITFLFGYETSENELNSNLSCGMSFYSRARTFLENLEHADHILPLLDKLVISAHRRNAESMADECKGELDELTIEQLDYLATIDASRINALIPEHKIVWLFRDGYEENDLKNSLRVAFMPNETNETNEPDEPHMS